ncbi:MAG: universal stress protein [Deltaproteobacteria bacterium]|nr:universal stress protein [Deltaproteobacteria bacterium]
MSDFPRILLGIALDPTDRATLRTCAALGARLGATHVSLLHAVRPPADLDEEAVRLLMTERQTLSQRAVAEAQVTLGDAVTVQARVVEGKPATVVLRTAHEEHYDLVALGRSTYGPGSRLGSDAGAIVRKAPCSVLAVPHGADPSLGKVLVPVDFSARSAEAIETALRILWASESPHLVITHLYEVHSAYGRTGRTEEEADAAQRAVAMERWTSFAKQFDFGEVHLELRFEGAHTSHILNSHHARQMLALIDAAEPDLIVISSQGRSNAAGVLLGSMAARLVAEADRSLLILRRPGDNVGLIEALMRL